MQAIGKSKKIQPIKKMTEINNDNIRPTTNQRLTMRFSSNSLSFSTAYINNGEQQIRFEPYTVKSGISMAANLREALKTAELPQEGFRKALVMTDTPVLIIPLDMFNEADCATMYAHSYPSLAGDKVLYSVLPDLSAVSVFSINKDLKLVVDDNFQDVKHAHAVSPVWYYLHQRSYIGSRNKLYGYFHDKKLEIFSFSNKRFKFCNSFDVSHINDALYFLLYVWKQLMLQPEYDEMHIVGDIPDKNILLDELKRYLQRAYVINPTADFNRAPATQISNMPYDLMALYVKGR